MSPRYLTLLTTLIAGDSIIERERIRRAREACELVLSNQDPENNFLEALAVIVVWIGRKQIGR